jgi:hypothetical protein
MTSMTPTDTELGHLLEDLRDELEGPSVDELDAALERLMQDELDGQIDDRQRLETAVTRSRSRSSFRTRRGSRA